MNAFFAGALVLVQLAAVQAVHAMVAPVQAAYGNVFPTLTSQSMTVARSGGAAPWYVSFNLLTESDVKLGALGLGAGSAGSYFDLTSIRLVSMAGQNVAFGTDTFAVNPFPAPIEALVVAKSLAAGQYALEVSGSGDRISCTPYCGDAADFIVRLQVTPDPTGNGQVDNTVVSPLRGSYGNVFPTMTQQSLTVARSDGAAPWYVSFDLLANANVKVGALGLGAGSNGSFFDLTSVRIVDMNGRNVAFGTDIFATNPFPDSVEALAVADALPAGHYAIEVSGSGDRISCTPYCGDAADFIVRLQVTEAAVSPAVPEPSAYGLMLAGLAIVCLVARRRHAHDSGARGEAL